MEEINSLLRRLPRVDELLKDESLGRFKRAIALKAVRLAIDRTRGEILKGRVRDFSRESILQEALRIAGQLSGASLRRVINATGIVIHTNLGRAPLAEEALRAVVEVSRGYSNLEFDLRTGKRGKRYDHLRGLLRDITGAEDALVVNNNAAAVLLCLSALARGKEVVVSRGELVEIGGAFRVPDVMLQSGATLREVGTTNKTHLRDYEEAITEATALLLKVHRSNYRIIGFTQEVELEALVDLGRRHSIPVMFDLGSGSLVDLKAYGIHEEPQVQVVLKKGTDLVTFSGDKLLGGPQAGIILGRKDLIETISRHPLTRAVRIDKMTLAALEATLKIYLDPEEAMKKVPVLKALFTPLQSLKRRASRLKRLLKEDLPEAVELKVERDIAKAGGGSLPEIAFDTYVLTISGLSAQRLHELLRSVDPPVVGRIREERYLLDMRTVSDDEVPLLKEAVKKAFNML